MHPPYDEEIIKNPDLNRLLPRVAGWKVDTHPGLPAIAQKFGVDAAFEQRICAEKTCLTVRRVRWADVFKVTGIVGDDFFFNFVYEEFVSHRVLHFSFIIRSVPSTLCGAYTTPQNQTRLFEAVAGGGSALGLLRGGCTGADG